MTTEQALRRFGPSSSPNSATATASVCRSSDHTGLEAAWDDVIGDLGSRQQATPSPQGFVCHRNLKVGSGSAAASLEELVLRFIVQPDRTFPSECGPRAAILVPDSWDDFGNRTSYDLWVRPDDGEMPIEIGRVKIAQVDSGPDRPPVGTFEQQLPTGLGHWVSLGQDDLYYEKIMDLGRETGREVLYGLGDLAAQLPMFDPSSTWQSFKSPSCGASARKQSPSSSAASSQAASG